MKWYLLSDRARKLRALNFIIGGRGIGKTYSTIDYVVNSGKPFLYLRNTDVQLKECSCEFGNPFKRWNLDHNRNIHIETERQHSLIYDYIDDKHKKLIGYAAALSTFGNLRGVDLSDVTMVIFDEFIERRSLTFDQAFDFSHFYETVNRNRELLGEEPLKVFMLSNAQKLDNPILANYGTIPVIEQMIKKDKEEYINPDLYINLPKSEISEAKKETVLYKVTAGTQYYQESLENKFAYDSFYGIIQRNVVEYMPVVKIDDMYIYRHKSKGTFYVCRKASNQVPEFTSKDNLRTFIRRYGLSLRIALADSKVEFSEFLIKTKFTELLR